ncbi:MAG: Na+/H+ antiporter NhaC [Bacteroidales bacterium]|nr:Na+/H+ antiporter NhaC [Bacteroidales bacterium]
MFKFKTGKLSFFETLIPIIFLIIALSYNVFVFKGNSLGGPNQLVLLFSAAIAALIGFRHGHKWSSIEKGVVKSISTAIPSILILLVIGSLAGTWLISGIVPALIYYGLQILNPFIFLFAACVICSIVSLVTGSSWSTAATIGIALVGIGKTLGIHEGLVVGAIISGAYFGDKISPMSDTTNLASAMAGTDLFTHIRYMTITTIPSISISLLLYLLIGFSYSSEASATNVDAVLKSIESTFNIHWALFIVPILVIFLIIKKVPALPVLLAGTLLGAVFAIIFQPHIVGIIAENSTLDFKTMYIGSIKAMSTRINIPVDNPIVSELFTTGGMYGMLNTVWLILCAMVFGGVMEATGMLRIISKKILAYANSVGSLIASTVGACLFFNITASDQYLAIVIPGKMFKESYEEKELAPQNLSRTLEDSGTVTSVLVPWNTCGATQSSVLGVATFIYAPFCFFNIISPIMTMIFAFFNIKIAKIKKEEIETLSSSN